LRVKEYNLHQKIESFLRVFDNEKEFSAYSIYGRLYPGRHQKIVLSYCGVEKVSEWGRVEKIGPVPHIFCERTRNNELERVYELTWRIEKYSPEDVFRCFERIETRRWMLKNCALSQLAGVSPFEPVVH